jgi:hypothetical protein
VRAQGWRRAPSRAARAQLTHPSLHAAARAPQSFRLARPAQTNCDAAPGTYALFAPLAVTTPCDAALPGVPGELKCAWLAAEAFEAAFGLEGLWNVTARTGRPRPGTAAARARRGCGG